MGVQSKSLASLWKSLTRILAGPVDAGMAVCEFDCRKSHCTLGDWEHCENRLKDVAPAIERILDWRSAPVVFDRRISSCLKKGVDDLDSVRATPFCSVVQRCVAAHLLGINIDPPANEEFSSLQVILNYQIVQSGLADG